MNKTHKNEILYKLEVSVNSRNVSPVISWCDTASQPRDTILCYIKVVAHMEKKKPRKFTYRNYPLMPLMRSTVYLRWSNNASRKPLLGRYGMAKRKSSKKVRKEAKRKRQRSVKKFAIKMIGVLKTVLPIILIGERNANIGTLSK